jgi:hypothetical protein
MTYLNLEYFYYKIFLFLKKSYFFIVNFSWPKIAYWLEPIATILIIIFAIGIIYNLIGIYRTIKKKKEEEL